MSSCLAPLSGVFGNKLKKQPKDPAGKYAAASTKECEEWLASAIGHAPKLRIATHVLKATHPQAAGSDWHNLLRNRDWKEIGTHSVAQPEEDIMASSAAYLGAASFLRAEMQGRRVLDWIRGDNQDFQSALHENPDTAREWMQTLRGLTDQPIDKSVSHSLAL